MAFLYDYNILLTQAQACIYGFSIGSVRINVEAYILSLKYRQEI